MAHALGVLLWSANNNIQCMWTCHAMYFQQINWFAWKWLQIRTQHWIFCIKQSSDLAVVCQQFFSRLGICTRRDLCSYQSYTISSVGSLLASRDFLVLPWVVRTNVQYHLSNCRISVVDKQARLLRHYKAYKLQASIRHIQAGDASDQWRDQWNAATVCLTQLYFTM